MCKQIPTIFLVALAFAILLITERTRLPHLARTLAVGAAVTIACMLALWIALGIDYSLVKIYFIDLPREVGTQRLSRLWGSQALARLSGMSARWPLFLPAVLVPCAVGCVALVGGILARRNDSFAVTVRQRLKGATLPLSLAVAFVATSLVFVLLTNNLPANGVPLLFAGLGLVHVAIVNILVSDLLMNSREVSLRLFAYPHFSDDRAVRLFALVRLEFRIAR